MKNLNMLDLKTLDPNTLDLKTKTQSTRKLHDLLNLKRLVTCGTLGALIVAPCLLSPQTAEAKPPSHAQAHGYGKAKKAKKDKKDKKTRKDKRYKAHDYDHDGDHHYGDDHDGNDHEGGDHDGNGHHGDPGTVGSAINLSGRVISVASSRQIVVRGDNGRTYTVSSRNTISSEIDRGDRVRVNGRLTANSRVTANQVVLIQDNNDPDNSPGSDNPSNGQTVDFRGTVQADLAGQLLTVRGDNGRTYRVRSNNNSTYNRGDRVRVVGTYANGIVVATSVSRL